ncbi:MAG: PD-(D/E)XK nuclease family protein [Flavobacteriales bacterium]|nr:PD-(D/E)XK nuclease family protein [Flavobacteriales bacterium]
MEPFLLQVARCMVAEHGTQMHPVAVVLPSARAGLHLRKHLAQVTGKALWSPEILTWDRFIEALAGTRRMGDLETLFELYAAHRTTRTVPDTLDAFLAWAPTTLADFNDADAQLLDLDRFYADLRALEGIEHWSLAQEHTSAAQERLLRYWHDQGQLHRAFIERSKAKSAGTAGFLARMAAERVKGGTQAPWDTVWFAGLNAFTGAQRFIVDTLVKSRTARLCWDADSSYIEHTEHEAGHFLRKALTTYGAGLVPIANDLRATPRMIHVATVPTSTAQALHAAALLADLSPEERAVTAVVLADESLLLPLLHALPQDIGPVNVTVGLRLRDLPVNGLIGSFLDVHRNHVAGIGYPLRDIERLLGHPFMRTRGLAHLLDAVLTALRTTGRDNVDHTTFVQVCEGRSGALRDLADALEPVVGSAAPIAARLNKLLAFAAEHLREHPFEYEQLYRMAGLHHDLQAQLKRAEVEFDLDAYTQLHERLVRAQRIAFFGEPLQGLQIMGMLETRAVDHERVIILSCNEGLLPPASSEQTFVPFDVRMVHGLPLAKDADALAAYTFHRLVQRATHVHLLATAEGGDAATGPSRYIAQLEADAVGTNTVITHTAYHAPLAHRTHAPIVVQKDAAVVEQLRKVLAKGMSPSAFGTFLRCPLDFHFKYVMGLKEPDPPGNELSANILGSAVHKALQLACTPLIDKVLTAAMVRGACEGLDDLLHAEVKALCPGLDLRSGHAHLQLHMAAEAMRRSLLADADDITNGTELEFIAFEKDVACDLPEAATLLGSAMRVRGRIDRVDRRNGTYRIMDIKTGSVKPADLKLADWDGELFNAKKEKALQLACYAFMFLNADPTIDALHSGIIPLQKPSLAGTCVLNIHGEDRIHRSSLPAIERVLLDIGRRILDPDVPFMHSTDAQHCAFCASLK